MKILDMTKYTKEHNGVIIDQNCDYIIKDDEGLHSINASGFGAISDFEFAIQNTTMANLLELLINIDNKYIKYNSKIEGM